MVAKISKGETSTYRNKTSIERAKMTFYTLDGLIGKVKRAAVDAYFSGFDFWCVKGDRYIYNDTQVDSNNPDEGIGLTAPDDHGNGGLEPFGGEEVLKSGGLNEWRLKAMDVMSRVDKALDKWRSLPEPSGLDGGKEICEAVYSCLANQVIQGDTEEGSKTPVFQGTIAKRLEGANDIARTQLSGVGMSSFKNNFLFRMQDIMNKFCGVSYVIETALVAERAGIDSARAAVLGIAKQARESFASVANQPHEEITAADVRIIAAGASAVAAIASGGTAWVMGAGLVALGLETIGDVMEREVKPAPQSYDTVMDNMEKALEEVNRQLKELEQAVRSNLKSNYVKMDENRHDFDLDFPVVHYDDVDKTDRNGGTNSRDTELKIGDVSLVREIADVTFPGVAAGVSALSQAVRSFEIALGRAADIGCGFNGPSLEFYDMKERLADLSRDLSEDILLGAHTLGVVLDMYEDIDYRSAKELDSKMAEFEGQASSSDPWQRKE